MKRFFGMMPSSEIEIEKSYKTDLGIIIIQAGPNGYSIIYGDGSPESEDISDTSENNFNKAYNIAKKLIS